MRKFSLWGLGGGYDIKGELENYQKAWAELDHKVTELEELTGLSIDEIIAAFKRGCNITEPFCDPNIIREIESGVL